VKNETEGMTKIDEKGRGIQANLIFLCNLHIYILQEASHLCQKMKGLYLSQLYAFGRLIFKF